MTKRSGLDLPRPFHGEIFKVLWKLIRPQVSTKGRNRESRPEKRSRDGSQWVKRKPSPGKKSLRLGQEDIHELEIYKPVHGTGELSLLSIPLQGGQSEVAPRSWGLHTHRLTWGPKAFWLGITCLRALRRPCGARDRGATFATSVTAQYAQSCASPTCK